MLIIVKLLNQSVVNFNNINRFEIVLENGCDNNLVVRKVTF